MSSIWNYNYAKIARDSGFKFQRCNDGALDWKHICSLDVEKIIKEQHFEGIENIVTHLSEAPLGVMLNTQILDKGVAKYFILSQLSIQYLLFCMKFLDETVINLKNSLHKIQNEKNDLKLINDDLQQQIIQLNKKIQRLEDINQIIYPCSMCTKNFISNEMLNVHISKRHSDIINREQLQQQQQEQQKSSTIETDRTIINTIKLELEVKNLKERLNVAEKEMRERLSLENHHCKYHEKNNDNIDNGNNVNKKFQTIATNTSNDDNNDDDDESLPLPIPNDNKLTINEESLTTKILNDISTQTHLNINHIGIQNNLDEIKEKDEIDENNGKQNHEQQQQNNNNENFNNEILIEIKDKLLQMENLYKNELNDNLKKSNLNDDNSLEISEKLNKILYTIENIILKQNELSNKDIILESDTVHDYHQSISELALKESIQYIQTAIKDDISKFYQNNEIKMNETLQKFELHLKENLENLEIKHSQSINDQILKTINSKVVLVDNDDGDNSNEILQNVRTLDQDENFNLQKKLIQKRLAVDIKSNLKHSIENSVSTDNNLAYANKSSKKNLMSLKRQNSLRKKHIILPKQALIKRKNLRTKIITKTDCLKMLNKRLRKLGVDPHSNTLEQSSKDHIFGQLTEVHQNQKKTNPNFLTTRNKLKRLIEKISLEKFRDRLKLHDTRKNTHEINLPATEIIAINPLNKSYSSEQDSEENFNDFKLRLERILESPIRKPSDTIKHFSSASNQNNQMENQSTPDIKNIITVTGVNEDLTKPIPAPRRAVTFQNTSTIRSNDEPSTSGKFMVTENIVTSDESDTISSY